MAFEHAERDELGAGQHLLERMRHRVEDEQVEGAVRDHVNDEQSQAALEVRSGLGRKGPPRLRQLEVTGSNEPDHRDRNGIVPVVPHPYFHVIGEDCRKAQAGRRWLVEHVQLRLDVPAQLRLHFRDVAGRQELVQMSADGNGPETQE